MLAPRTGLSLIAFRSEGVGESIGGRAPVEIVHHWGADADDAGTGVGRAHRLRRRRGRGAPTPAAKVMKTPPDR